MERNEVLYSLVSAGLVFGAFAALTIPARIRRFCPCFGHRLLFSGLFSIGVGLLKEVVVAISSIGCEDDYDEPTTFCQGFNMWDILVNINGTSLAVFFVVLCELIYEERFREHVLSPVPCDSTVASTVLNEDIDEFEKQHQQPQENANDEDIIDCSSVGTSNSSENKQVELTVIESGEQQQQTSSRISQTDQEETKLHDADQDGQTV